MTNEEQRWLQGVSGVARLRLMINLHLTQIYISM